MKLFKRSRDMPQVNAGQVHAGQASEINMSSGGITPHKSKSVRLLERLRHTYNVYDAIKLLIEEHPDTSMGFAVLQALVNQGGKIEFTGCSRASPKRIKDEWDRFAERVNGVSSNGLEGLLVQLHGFDFAEGGMACEVVVRDDLSDIEDVYPIPPSELAWELERRDGKQRWIPYQCVNGKKIDLSRANFLWVPFNPKASPEGSLLFAPAVPAADMQLMFFESSQSVLYRVGCPRYDININKERLIASAPADVKASKEKTRAYIKSTFADTAAQFRNMSVENDIIHTDDIDIKTIGGESSAYFQGIGAYADIIDVQMMNAVKTLGTLMNRRSSGSYALSTVEFKVIVDMLEPRQRAEKRLVESIARIWLRVHGYNTTVKYTPNPIEWQTMLDKIDYSLKNQQFYRRSDEYGYISPDEAAQKINGSEKAYADRTGLFEYINKLFSKDGKNSDNSENENGGDIN